MYNPLLVKESFMKEELDKVPETNIRPFLDGRSLMELESWRLTFEGKFNGYQLKFKKPYVITQLGKIYTLWTEIKLGGVR